MPDISWSNQLLVGTALIWCACLVQKHHSWAGGQPAGECSADDFSATQTVNYGCPVVSLPSTEDPSWHVPGEISTIVADVPR